MNQSIFRHTTEQTAAHVTAQYGRLPGRQPRAGLPLGGGGRGAAAQGRGVQRARAAVPRGAGRALHRRAAAALPPGAARRARLGGAGGRRAGPLLRRGRGAGRRGAGAPAVRRPRAAAAQPAFTLFLFLGLRGLGLSRIAKIRTQWPRFSSDG